MNIKRTLKNSDAITGIVRDIKKAKIPIKIIKRNLVIKKYIKTHAIKKLQIGAGLSILDSWLMTDYCASLKDSTVYLDVTKRFPMADNTFDYVFCEHLIEHLPYEQGTAMIRECHRVLKSNGNIRIGTPNIETILNLLGNNHNPMQEKYISWIVELFIQGAEDHKEIFVINNAFRNWGHQFLYSKDLLQNVLIREGFDDVKEMPMGESGDANLRNIETHGIVMKNEEAAKFETMIFEGTCIK
jgi:predicted SAM-dependent methyltransferase